MTGHISSSETDVWTWGIYHFTDARTWFYLQCLSPDPPDDGWQSIAQTFQFLPDKNKSPQ